MIATMGIQQGLIEVNDEPNTVDWKVGDIVIHDADAKHEGMLMVIIGHDAKTKLYQSKYLNPKYTRSAQIYANEKKYLHDPLRFNIFMSASL